MSDTKEGVLRKDSEKGSCEGNGRQAGNSGTVFMIGFMASGKTTVGKLLAGLCGAQFLDTDEEIVKLEGRSIPDIFADSGEPCFRDLETKVLAGLREEKDRARVISVGGGLPVREENRRIMRETGKTIYLTASVETLKGRLQGDTGRPMLANADLEERIRFLMEQRGDQYLDAADVCIATDDLTAPQVAAAAKEWLDAQKMVE